MIEQLTAPFLWHSMEQHTLAAPLLVSRDYPWQVLSHLCDFIRSVGEALPTEEYENILPAVWVARTARLAENVHIDASARPNVSKSTMVSAYCAEYGRVSQT